jgi:hypothetical protein
MLLSGVEPNMEFQLFQKDGKTELKRKGELFKRMSDSKGSVCFEDLPHRQYVVKGGDGESIFIKGKVRKKSKGGLTFIRKT